MKYLNLTKSLAAAAMFSLIFTACDKAKVATPMGDAGQTLVKILGGGTPASVLKKPIDFVPTSFTMVAVEIRRDIPNETELNKTMIVTVKDDTAAVRAAGLLNFPTAWHSVAIAGGVKAGGQGGTWTLTFTPGEFSKTVFVTIPNATLLDPSALYGLGYTILTADQGGVLSTQKSAIVEIGAKNNYDGQYAVTGPMVDLTNPAFVQWNNPAFGGFPSANGGAWELHLITTGATECLMFDNTIWGNFFHPILNGAANSGWGSYALRIFFNPASGAISNVRNYYGETAQGGTGAPDYRAGNTRYATLDPSGVNAVQGNKDILIKYFMHHPSVVAAPPHIRVTFDEKWKYIGPR